MRSVPQYSALSLFAQLCENGALSSFSNKWGFLLYIVLVSPRVIRSTLDSYNMILTYFSLPHLRALRYNGTVVWLDPTRSLCC